MSPVGFFKAGPRGHKQPKKKGEKKTKNKAAPSATFHATDEEECELTTDRSQQ